MATKFPYKGIARRAGTRTRTAQDRAERTHGPPVPALADRACCCPAKPVVIAVMPIIGHDLSPVDIHLCAHHYRQSRKALAEAGAAVFDGSGLPVTDLDPYELLRNAR